nr:putative reverse transcriptase domain-containing protein [Tanacetum cinerariifolium]
MSPRMRTRCTGRHVAKSRRGGISKRVGRGGRGRGPRGGNDERVNDMNGQGNDQGLGANENVEGVNEGPHRVTWNHAMVGAGHAAYTNRFHKLARLVPHLVTPESRKIERNGSIKNVEKRRNVGKPSKDKNGRDDNKRTRTGNDFAMTKNPIRRENMSAWHKCTTCNSYHAPGGSCRTCFNYNRPGHLERDYRVVHRNVNPVNIRNPTPARRACYEYGKVLRVLRERPKEKARLLMSANASDEKQGEIVVVIDFLEDKLCNAPVLALPDGPKDFVVYFDASGLRLGCVLIQRVVFSFKIWRHYLYGRKSVIYTDHKSLQHIFSQKELNMRQHRWIELFSDYDFEIRYHPYKVNVVADSLSMKDIVKPKKVKAMNITLQSSIKDRILAAQKEAVDESARLQRSLDEMIKQKNDETLYYNLT